MKNTFIIDRWRYDQLMLWCNAANRGGYHGLPGYALQLLDFYVIEEEDGSATFIKNRHNGLNAMNKEEYYYFKRDYMN